MSVNVVLLLFIIKVMFYMLFKIKMFKLFKMYKSATYMFGMFFLFKVFVGFGVDVMVLCVKNVEFNVKFWDLSIEFCKENGVKSCEAYNL